MDDKLIQRHFLVPEHIRLSEDEKKKFLEEKNLSLRQLPMIKINDSAIQHLEAEEGDVIKIKRKSDTVGESEFYRVVIVG